MDEQLAALARDLRALERDALARLTDEPWLHVKRVLAEHAAEDAASAAALEGLLPDPAGGPVAQRPVEDRNLVQARLATAAGALVEHAVDERVLRILVELELRQRRHGDELPPRRAAALAATGIRDPFVPTDPDAAPDPIDEAVSAAETAAREGDAATAAARMRDAAQLDAERARDGDPWGLRPIPSDP